LVIVGLFKNEGVKFRNVLDDFDVGIDVNFPLEFGGEIENVDLLEDILGTQFAPGFLESRGRREMATACCDCCNQDPHSTPQFMHGAATEDRKNNFLARPN